jgi:hypothetical protein
MKNEFVTYEQALALKELGFLPEHSFGYYYNCKFVYIILVYQINSVYLP